MGTKNSDMLEAIHYMKSMVIRCLKWTIIKLC